MSDHEFDDGVPAFPLSHRYDSDPSINIPKPGHDGMSLRDYMAAKALSGILASPKTVWNFAHPEIIACNAYLYADAMLAARNATPEDGKEPAS